MNFALVFLSAIPAPNLPTAVPAAPLAVEVTTYDAFVATEETPRLQDLKHPAIAKREGRNKAISSPAGPDSIA